MVHMNSKQIIITTISTLIIGCLLILNFIANKYILKADSIYKIYLDGNIIGYIANDDELYTMINNRQKEIKDKYKVKKVYPPESFEIIKTNSYNAEISSVEDIYNRLAQIESFTIDGYIINIKGADDEKVTINVLDKEVFDEAVHNFVLAFLDEEDYNNFTENTQAEIETTGKIIEKMYFDETITIKKGFVDVRNKIFTSQAELSQYLLFGPKAEITTYKVNLVILLNQFLKKINLIIVNF